MSKRRHDDYAVLSRGSVEDWYLQLVDDEIRIGSDGSVLFANSDKIPVSWSYKTEDDNDDDDGGRR